ncbi:MAG: PIN domain-containing protein [Chloroflexota bacterium]
MRYWDPSALVPMIAPESATATVFGVLEQDRAIVTWWGSSIECASAVARRGREGFLEPRAADVARFRLRLLAAAWTEIEPSEPLRQTAMRLLRTHPLRAADALQLAAAIIAADGSPETLPFVTRDDRLGQAASIEGFPVITPQGG